MHLGGDTPNKNPVIEFY